MSFRSEFPDRGAKKKVTVDEAAIRFPAESCSYEPEWGILMAHEGQRDVVVKYNIRKLHHPWRLSWQYSRQFFRPSKLRLLFPYLLTVCFSLMFAEISCDHEGAIPLHQSPNHDLAESNSMSMAQRPGYSGENSRTMNASSTSSDFTFSCEELPGNQQLENLGQKLDTFVSFFFAGYVGLVLNRWWAIRTNGIGAVTDACGNITRQLSMFCLDTKNKNKVREAITRIYEIAAWSMVFMSTKGNERLQEREAERKREEDVFIQGLEEGDALAFNRMFEREEQIESGEDLCTERSLDHAQLAWARIGALATNLLRDEKVAVNHWNMVYQQIEKACTGINTQGCYLQTQLPLRYVWVVHAMIKIDTILFVFRAGPELIKAWNAYAGSHRFSWALSLQLLCTIFSISVFPLVYNLLLGLCIHMEDPMGGDRYDFPLEVGFIRPTVAFCKKLLDAYHPPDPPAEDTAQTPRSDASTSTSPGDSFISPSLQGSASLES